MSYDWGTPPPPEHPQHQPQQAGHPTYPQAYQPVAGPVDPWAAPPLPPPSGGGIAALIAGGVVAVLLVVGGGIVAVRAWNERVDPLVSLRPPGSTAGGGSADAAASPSAPTGQSAPTAPSTDAGVPSAGASPASANGTPDVKPDTGTAPKPVPPGVLVIASDLPLQGASAEASDEANRAMEGYLELIGHQAGGHRIRLRTYDDSTPAQGAWDERTCVANARKHVQRVAEVAVVGTYNSGCTKLQLPVLNKAPGGPLLMVSHANSNPGLTTRWLPGEPGTYSPTGVRGYARVSARDDQQGIAVADYAVEGFRAKACAVLDDGTTYGAGVADAFAAHAKDLGVRVVTRASWEAGTTDYRVLFTAVKAKKPECVFLGGIADNDGAELITAKVAVLGSNSAVPLLAADGFVGYPEIDALPAAQGMYLSFPGATADQLLDRLPARMFLNEYRGTDATLVSSYTLYAVAALQVVLAAIEAGDGTRAGVRGAVLGSGKGVTVSSATSVVGAELAIDPATGDLRESEVSIVRITAKREDLVTVRTVGLG